MKSTDATESWFGVEQGFPEGVRQPDAGIVHLWDCLLQTSEVELAELEPILETDEQRRALRFHESEDRRRFIVRRGRLRRLLGGYLGLDPGSLRFATGPYGKPALQGPGESSGLRFSVSASGDLALFGVTTARELGVDVEQVRELDMEPLLTDRLFSSQELSRLRGLFGDERRRAFFACWTLKEAYGKGSGLGIATNPPGWDVSSALLGSGVTKLSGWSLVRVNVAAGYAAALALEGDLHDSIHWRWPGDA